jgi:hypothetical protein
MLPRRLSPALAGLGLVVGLVAGPGQAAEIEGVDFPDRHQWGNTGLRLQGLGLLRYRIFLKGYVAALYLGDGVGAEQVLEDVPRRLEIEYFWSIPADAFAEATLEGIARHLDAETFERMRGPIARLNRLYADVEPGDRYALTYIPGSGTELALNGEPLGRVEGAEFSSALFGIWLGERSFDAALREKLLARR